jgi:hypothetical protein
MNRQKNGKKENDEYEWAFGEEETLYPTQSQAPTLGLECLAMSFAQIFSFALLFDEESESTNMVESWGGKRRREKAEKLLYLEQTEPEDERRRRRKFSVSLASEKDL